MFEGRSDSLRNWGYTVSPPAFFGCTLPGPKMRITLPLKSPVLRSTPCIPVTMAPSGVGGCQNRKIGEFAQILENSGGILMPGELRSRDASSLRNQLQWKPEELLRRQMSLPPWSL